jgi:hypothetical protein
LNLTLDVRLDTVIARSGKRVEGWRSGPGLACAKRPDSICEPPRPVCRRAEVPGVRDTCKPGMSFRIRRVAVEGMSRTRIQASLPADLAATRGLTPAEAPATWLEGGIETLNEVNGR